MTKLFDEDEWEFESADPSVGLFGEGWIHAGCPKEFEDGVEWERRMHGKADATGHVAETHTLTCRDCGAKATFEAPVYVGEYGVDYV